MPYIALQDAIDPLVVAIDVGTSSARAIAFDAHARQIDGLQARIRYATDLTPVGGETCDALAMRTRVIGVLEDLKVILGDERSRVAAVGLCTHWHSLLGLDSHGSPLTPVYMWSDKRARADAVRLASGLDEVAIHERTGCRLHSSYWPARLRWLARTDPSTFARVDRWVSMADWLFAVDGAELVTSHSMASGTGLLASADLAWDEELLAVLGVQKRALPRLVRRQDRLNHLHPSLQQVFGDIPWFPALGDGATANIGTGCTDASSIALTIGTSGAMRVACGRSMDRALPASLWRYLIDDELALVGGALSNGGNALAWLSQLTGTTDYRANEAEAAAVAPDGHGLTVLPFLAGERAPSWNDSVAGTLTGITLDTTRGEMHRALLEAAAYRFADVYADLHAFANEEHRILASGGAFLASPLWSQIMADTLDTPIHALQSHAEASARGAAICALAGIGVISSLTTAESDPTQPTLPDAGRAAIYASGRARQSSLERQMRAWEQHERP